MPEKFRAKVVMLKGEPGASGDYSGLTNKPQINGLTLNGNKTAAALGLASAAQLAQTSARIDQILQNSTATFAGIDMTVYETDPTRLTWNSSVSKYTIEAGWDVPAGYVILEAAVGKRTASTWSWQTDAVEMWAGSTRVQLRYGQDTNPANYFALRLIIAVAEEVDLDELTDIRVDVDGETHDSAGDAVRAQIQALQDQIDAMTETLNSLGDGASRMLTSITALEGAASMLIVNVTGTVDSETGTVCNPTADNTYAYILSQIDAGVTVYVKLNGASELIPLTAYNPAIVAGETGSITFSKEYAPDPTEPDEKTLVSITLTDAGGVSARKVSVSNAR